MNSAPLIAAAVAIMSLASEPAGAAVVTYIGIDSGWSSAPPVGPNSLAAEQSFLLATGAADPITFAGGSYPSDISITLDTPYGGSGILGNGTGACGFAVCGGDTDGDGWFLYLHGGSAKFTFTKPASYFGAYFSGLQLDDSISWTDASGAQSLVISISPADYYIGAMAFAGFTDFGQSITSVTITAGTDAIGVDDVYVPEPAAWTMMLVGIAGLGLACRRRRRDRRAILAA